MNDESKSTPGQVTKAILYSKTDVLPYTSRVFQACPLGLRIAAILSFVAGVCFVVVSIVGAIRCDNPPPGFAVQPYFGIRMTANTFFLFGVILGLALMWLAYAFYHLHRAGFVVFMAANALNLLNHLIYFETFRIPMIIIDVACWAFIASYWRSFFGGANAPKG